jgi:pentatricopeptide repeat domain-containing protein 1
MISALGKGRKWKRAMWLFESMGQSQTVRDAATYAVMVFALARCEEWTKVPPLFREVWCGRADSEEPVTYIDVIEELGNSGLWKEAVKLFDVIGESGFNHSSAAYTATIAALGVGGECEQALQLFSKAELCGIEPDAAMCSAGAVALAKGGDWEQALRLLIRWKQNFPERDYAEVVNTYAAVITALGRAGQWQQALRAFYELGERVVDPGPAVYNVVISALRRAGEYEKAHCLAG